MKPDQRVVVSAPLDELWTDLGPIEATRGRAVGQLDIDALLRAGAVRIVVADIGSPLKWIPADEALGFWKKEVRPRLVTPSQATVFRLEDFPGEYSYLASQWHDSSGAMILLFERYH